MSSSSGVLKNAGVMGIAVFLSRILGLVREQVFAFFFGAGIFADAYLVAFRIPNLLRDLFAEGALSSAFVSVFSKSSGQEESLKLYKTVKIAFGAVLFFVTLAIFFAAPALVQFLAPRFLEDPEKFQTTVILTRIFSPFLFFASMAALAMGVLNTRGSFFIPSMGSAAFNVGNIVIGGGAAFFLKPWGPQAMVLGFGAGTLVGGFLQWAVQWPELRRKGFPQFAGLSQCTDLSSQKKAWSDSGLRRILKIMGPSVVSVAAVQINVLVNTLFATGLGTGSVAWLSYAFRILHFPMGIFGVSLSTASLPRLAKLRAENNLPEFSRTLVDSQIASLFLAVGSAVGIWTFAEPLCALFFEYGRFTRTDTLQTAEVLRAYAIGLFAFNGTKIFVQAFYAFEAVWIPSFVSIIAIIINYLGNSYFAPRFGVAALAGVTSAVAILNFFSLALWLSKFGVWPLGWRFWRSALVSVLCSFVILGFSKMGWPQQVLALKTQGTGLFVTSTLALIALAGGMYLVLVGLLDPAVRPRIKKLLRLS